MLRVTNLLASFCSLMGINAKVFKIINGWLLAFSAALLADD